MDEYDGRQFVGIDLHRQRSVIVRQSESGEQLSAVRIVNDPVALELQLEQAGADPEVVLEATYGWYWAVDVLHAGGARVHLAHPLGVKGFRYRRVKNDVRDAADLTDLLRMGRLPEAWIAPPETRELRELVRYRAKLVAIRSGLKAQIHAVLAKAGVLTSPSSATTKLATSPDGRTVVEVPTPAMVLSRRHTAASECLTSAHRGRLLSVHGCCRRVDAIHIGQVDRAAAAALPSRPPFAAGAHAGRHLTWRCPRGAVCSTGQQASDKYDCGRRARPAQSVFR